MNLFIHVSNNIQETIKDYINEDTMNDIVIFCDSLERMINIRAELEVFDNPKCKARTILVSPENFRHPSEQYNILNQLVDINLPIHVFTNSPYILEGFQEHYPLIAWVNTIAHYEGLWDRFSNHPNIDFIKGALSLGEAWDAEGEDWVSSIDFSFSSLENEA
jgi:hypothetical protein